MRCVHTIHVLYHTQHLNAQQAQDLISWVESSKDRQDVLKKTNDHELEEAKVERVGESPVAARKQARDSARIAKQVKEIVRKKLEGRR